MAYSCLLKTFAFISALMSVAVLASSIVVLISSVTCMTINNETSGNSSQDNNSTSFTPLLSVNHPPEDNETGAYTKPLHFPFVRNMTAHQLSVTTSSSLLNEQEEKNISTGLSASVSDASTLPNTTANANNPAPTFPVKVENVDSGFVEPTGSTTTATTPTAEPWNAFCEYQYDFWEAKSDTYIVLIHSSSGTGIFAAVLQLGFSWLLICGSAKDLKDRTTLWNLSNFIVLILVVVIILVPLSYDSTNNTFKGTGVFWREIYRKIKSVEFSSKTLETVWNSFPIFLVKDLSLYYYVLGVDAFLLLALLIPPFVCCFCYPCKRCCCKGKRGRSESDLTLFGAGGGSASGEHY